MESNEPKSKKHKDILINEMLLEDELRELEVDLERSKRLKSEKLELLNSNEDTYDPLSENSHEYIFRRDAINRDINLLNTHISIMEIGLTEARKKLEARKKKISENL